MEDILKNFRGFFSQSSLNTLAAVVQAASAEAQSGDLQISARAQNFLTLGSMVLGFTHLLVNAVPALHVADVAPAPGAAFPGSLDAVYPPAAPALAAPAAPIAAAPAPPPTAPEPAPAPAPAEPAPTGADASGVAAPASGLAALLAGASAAS